MPKLLETPQSFEETVKEAHLTAVHFAADWVEQCKQIDDVLDAFANQPEYSSVRFCKCQAEDLAEISLRYKIEAVPTTILFLSGKVIDRVDGADAAKLTAKIKQHNKTKIEKDSIPLNERLKQLINHHKVMLFMKGDRNTPRCGFSKQMIQILNDASASYDTFDILSDEEVRQGLKKFSDWPTYPQLYVKGELIGGLDIVKEIQSAGELPSTLNA